MRGLRARKKDQVRWAIARAALRLFEQSGFEQTTIEAIADEANVSPRTFFRYFAAKEDVVLVDPDRKLEIIGSALTGQHDEMPMLDAIEAAWSRLADEYLSDPGIALAIYRLSRSEPALGACMLAFQTRWTHVLAAAIADHLGVDPADDIRPEVIASTLQAAVRAATNRWAEQGCPAPARDAVASGFRSVHPALLVIVDQLAPTVPPTIPAEESSSASASRADRRAGTASPRP